MTALFIVPSKGRPHNVDDLIQQWRNVTDSAHLLIAVDKDDPKKDEYFDVYRKYGHDSVDMRSADADFPRGMLGPLNYFALLNYNMYEFIGFMGDDHRPRTLHWDTQLIDKLKSTKNLMAYGNDLLQGHNLPTQILMDSRVIKTLGHMAPRVLHHLYIDNYWKTLGVGARRIVYVPTVVIEHMHPAAAKAEWDAEYEAVNSGNMYEHDYHALEAYTNEGLLDADIRMIKDL